MINLLFALIYISILALIFAFWEVQIEGRHGHAAGLPCWRKEDGWIVKYILRGTHITGYHLGMHLFLLSSFHFTFLFLPWSAIYEITILGMIIQFLVLEDFFWFLINPHYGLRKFKKEFIHWHKEWWGPVPSFYIYLTIIAGFLLFFGQPR